MFLLNGPVHHENGAGSVVEGRSRHGAVLMCLTGADHEQVAVQAPADRLVRLPSYEHGGVREAAECLLRLLEHPAVVGVQVGAQRGKWRCMEHPEHDSVVAGELDGTREHRRVVWSATDERRDATMTPSPCLDCAPYDDRVAPRRTHEGEDVAAEPERRSRLVLVAQDDELCVEGVLGTVRLDSRIDEFRVRAGPTVGFLIPR